jgi:radical SAM protein
VNATQFDRVPMRVYWEVTRACGLACRHCRAEASLESDPDELSTGDGRAVLERIAAFGEPKPHVILTGGDPLERKDLFELIAYARTIELRVSVSPSATPRLTPDVVGRLAAAGVDAISLSIDGSSAERHDAFRGVNGCFARTLEAARATSSTSLQVQVNSLVCAETLDDLPAIYDLVRDLGLARWSLFFLVTVGRGSVLQPVDAASAENLLRWLASLPRGAGVPTATTTEAPHFRRILLEQSERDRRSKAPSTPTGHAAGSSRAGHGVRDGNGVMFISNTGDVSPSGFLPIAVGNVRRDDLVEIYRTAPLFVALRQTSGFGGRCGRCEYRELCGGSRARAWAASGSALAEDPLCAYEPGSPEVSL